MCGGKGGRGRWGVLWRASEEMQAARQYVSCAVIRAAKASPWEGAIEVRGVSCVEEESKARLSQQALEGNGASGVRAALVGGIG